MARFERSRGRRDSKDRSPRGEKTFEEFMKGKGKRDSGRSRGGSGRGRDKSPKRFGNKRGHLEMTKVICSECGKECEVPFKPTSTKPVYCSDCFEKHDKKGSSRNSSEDLDKINKKLDKIMKALEIK